MAHSRNLPINQDKNLQAYVIGLALGDGNLSKTNQTVKLRVTCDNKYPKLMQRIADSLQLLLPDNKVGFFQRDENCTDVYVYSKYLETLLGWQADMGSKFNQLASIPEWIKEKSEYKINCLRGLIETDGSIYKDRGYPMVMFVSIIPPLANEVYEIINSLGFKSYLYKIIPKKNKYNYNQQPLYHVRLSKNVSKFLDLVNPDKS